MYKRAFPREKSNKPETIYPDFSSVSFHNNRKYASNPESQRGQLMHIKETELAETISKTIKKVLKSKRKSDSKNGVEYTKFRVTVEERNTNKLFGSQFFEGCFVDLPSDALDIIADTVSLIYSLVSMRKFDRKAGVINAQLSFGNKHKPERMINSDRNLLVDISYSTKPNIMGLSLQEDKPIEYQKIWNAVNNSGYGLLPANGGTKCAEKIRFIFPDVRPLPKKPAENNDILL